MADLLTALELRDEEKVDRYICTIQRDGWKAFLRKVHKNDMRAIFKYLAKAEGRKRWGFIPEDASPLLNEHGQLIVSINERTRLITDTSRKRFTAPAEINPALTRHNPNHVPLAPFREQITGEFQPIQLVEIIKAVQSLSGNRAPGPDGITATPLH